jgi:hypothetical protein
MAKVDESKWSDFLDHFTKPNDNQYNRVSCAHMTGVPPTEVDRWFKQEKFLDKLQRSLKKAVRDKSKIKETLIESAIAIASASITDCFGIDPITGDEFIIPPRDLPLATQMALQEYKVIRVRVPDEDGNMRYRDVLHVKLIDKVAALRLLGDWTDVKSDEKKLGEEKARKILGLTIITNDEPTKELTDGNTKGRESGQQEGDPPGASGEVQLHQEADDRIEEVWIGE